MLSVRAFRCRAGISHYSALLSVSRSLPKSFSTWGCINYKLLPKCKPVQNLKIFSKPQVKFEFFSRNAATFAIQRSAKLVRKQVGYWLLFCSGMVYGAIVIGGYTRLSESGLSMVNWNFTFEALPLSNEEWDAEFKKYKEYPEYKHLKEGMTLDEFKRIWKVEYLHRSWGRCLAMVYSFPAAVFWYLGCFKPEMKKRVTILGVLVCVQGLMGWYMVQSGLEDRFHNQADIPRVSQYRLAAHLGLALTIFSGFFWTALDLLLPPEKISALTPGIKKFRIMAHSCKGLVFLTALSGAFVAGLDAGLIYNSFPKMGDKWIPDDILAISPKIKNFTDNPTTVQFGHRILAMTTLSAILATWLISRRCPLPRRARLAANYLALASLFQVALGISTLVHLVPTSLAISHQSGSVLLLTTAIWLSHELKVLKYIPK